jgi:Fur family ferric uptake transcriptional regulator
MLNSAAIWQRPSVWAGHRDRAGKRKSNKLRRIERNMAGPSGPAIFFWSIALIDESAGDTKYRHMETRIDLEALCQERGLRITDQRRVIARVISDADDHPDVEELYRRASAIDPKISIATVYRTVRLFEEAGILDRHDFGDGRARYEASPEAHHDHLIDVETGKVIEFVDPELEALQKQIAEKLGYRLVDHRMELYGVAISRDD